jgi:hypothetical protein
MAASRCFSNPRGIAKRNASHRHEFQLLEVQFSGMSRVAAYLGGERI